MARSGDWITPVSGPLRRSKGRLYWLQAAAFQLGLSPDLAPRLPIALLALAFLVFYWWTLRREFGCRAAWIATLILGTSGMWVGYSQAGVTDIPLTVTYSAGMLLALPWVAKRDTRYLPAAAGMFGLAVLAKGHIDGATDLIGWLHGQGVAVSIGHSAAGADEAWAAYEAGARSTTHLLNAMTGVDHRNPGVAVAALLEDDAYVELIADGVHVHPAIWPLITRMKAPDRLLLVSDALAVAGTTQGRGRVGGLDIEVRDGRATLAGTDTLAGSVIALDIAVRNLAAAGVPLPARSLPRAETRLRCSGSRIVVASPKGSAPISSSSTRI